MKPTGTPVASIILSELHSELREQFPTAYLEVTGRGILTPGVQIPNEWWDRKRLVYNVQVDKPQITAEGVLAVGFKGRCDPEHIEEMKGLMQAGIRELLEREIVPPLLLALGMLSWSSRNAKSLQPVAKPFGTPVDWGAEQDLILHEVADQGMLASEHYAARRPRVRVIDT